MYTYSLTFSIDPAAEAGWLDYMLHDQVPAMEETGFFAEVSLCRIEAGEAEDEAPGYHLMCRTETLEQLRMYMAQAAAVIHGRHDKKFGKRVFVVDALLRQV